MKVPMLASIIAHWEGAYSALTRRGQAYQRERPICLLANMRQGFRRNLRKTVFMRWRQCARPIGVAVAYIYMSWFHFEAFVGRRPTVFAVVCAPGAH